MAEATGPFTVCGTAFHTPRLGVIEVLEDALIAVGGDGTIRAVALPSEPAYAGLRREAETAGQLTRLAAGQYLLPGFVDLHVHAPQFPQLGKALDLPLARWLKEHTFPLEARYADLGFARRIYTALVETLLANGTTTALYFATIHDAASAALAEICLDKGQRALIGRVAMDHPEQCPDFYRDRSAEAAIDGTRGFIHEVRGMRGNEAGLVRPVVTPRFVPACTDRLLDGLGRVAEECGCAVQTHCSESDWEHAHVLARFGKSDTAALADFGLVTDRTILAHSNFVAGRDLDLIAAAGAGIAHCPLSNFYFANSVFPLRAALQKGVRVGLGTDISAGHSPSILDACRSAVAASRALEDGVDPALPPGRRGRPGSRVTYGEAFWLATTGGGEALGLPVGMFAPGFAFDAILVDVHAPGSNVRLWEELDGPADVLQKILAGASRANILRSWVQGRVVHEAG